MSKRVSKRKRKRDYASDSSEEVELKEVDTKPKLPVHHEWLWKYTQVQSSKKTSLPIEDIKQLLITRGESENDLKNLKQKKIIKRLLTKHTVWLKTPIKELTNEQLRVELALHDIYNRSTRIKQLMINKYIDGMIQKFPPPAWKYMHQLPSTHFTNPLMLTQNKIFIAIKNKPIMYKYNICDNIWREWINYESYVNEIVIKTICISVKDKMIYICDNKCNLIKIHYKQSKFSVETIKNTEGINFTRNSTRHLVFVDNELHMMRIGASDTAWPIRITLKHLIFDEKLQQFTVKHTLSVGKCLKFEHLKSRNKLICVGGDDNNWNCSRSLKIFLFDLSERHWTICGINGIEGYDVNFYNFGCDLTRDENRIILYPHCGSNLFIIDMVNNDKKLEFKLMKCKIKFPTAGEGKRFQTIVMRNVDKEECIVFGYVRKVWKKYDIGMERFPPQYILRLIKLWYLNDYYDDMHILKYFEDGSVHCAINVRDIVDNVYTK
eukprot:174846_1